MSDKKPKIKKKFDFTKYKQRHVALKILYFGWDYSGLAGQGDCETTIEYHLLQALTKTCLIESRYKCNFNRCGRTDKGVSSFGQVLSLYLKSNLIDEDDPNNVGLFKPECYDNDIDVEKSVDKDRKELNYVDILNHNLPDHIKVIAWAPIKKEFSARFNCKSRSYSYIFPKGDLCISSMQEALSYLIGEHDFRNLCSFDLKNGVINHVRTITSANISSIEDNCNRNDQYQFYNMTIVGHAFLYHQIRCIMTILFLVGAKKESPTVTRDLLDLKKCPAKPRYGPASPLPLSLFDCRYNPEDLPLGWYHDKAALCKLIKQMKQLWCHYKTKSLMIEHVLKNLEFTIVDSETDNNEIVKLESELTRWKDFGIASDNMSDDKYVQLLKRSCDDTLELKLENLDRKKMKKSDGKVD